ncbi:hypothetical protein F5984_02020 [Rudanella paleaurantiibacter]|uniref:Uncharacterized protein n=1 Tax=Rudanella paleaurantiibacter TaxID=2614655 RepID=A0A7J5U6H1_9BACT|nr:hypothetical protein [Rudanella paleaurantiibacter]KAB7732750.1 hypothetical protein F5984_02020 [Rudanella paleaurantiibacter]
MKLNETLLLAGAAGALLIWLLELQRTSFAESYIYLMLCLALLFTLQFVRNKRIQREKQVSPTIKQMAADQKKKKQK